MNINKDTLLLFNAIQIYHNTPETDLKIADTIRHGFVLSPSVAAIADKQLIEDISQFIGISPEWANSTFHKSWSKIANASIEQLLVEQITHYFTTYGLEYLGIYNHDYVYIPAEQLDIPDINEAIKLTIINGLTKEEILKKIIDLGSGIALKKETIESIMNIVEYNKYSSDIISYIKNYELLSRLYDLYDIVPSDPVQFLRYTVFTLTGESLLIKNSDLINKIKQSQGSLASRTLNKLIDRAPYNLAEIFFRFKPIFLALKSISNNKTFFNQLRKRANIMHQPMSLDLLSGVTADINMSKGVNVTMLHSALNGVNIFRKIRLANALLYRLDNPKSILYKIRNGKGYVADAINMNRNSRDLQLAASTVINHIAGHLKLSCNTVYIPEYIEYAVPSSEKMFTGNFPMGTYVKSKNDLVLGIHWFNNNDHRVDLDLSLISKSGKLGWDRGYFNEDKSILFSGDVTTAPKPNGATELFYIKHGIPESSIMMVNYFNYSDITQSDAKIIVSSAKPDNFKLNYMIDPNDILASACIKFDTKENVLGMICSIDGENRLYFANTVIGNGITSRSSDKSVKLRECFESSLLSNLMLSTVLQLSGLNVVRTRPVGINYIDLSPESIDKSTIIDLLNNKYITTHS